MEFIRIICIQDVSMVPLPHPFFFHGATVQAWILQRVKARLASALLFGRRCGEAADEERKYIDEKILEEKTELARKIVFVAWLI